MPLLEVLIAFIIAALSLGVLVRGAGDGVGSAQVAAHYQEALSRAQSRLAAAAAVAPQPGQQQGDDGGGFRWTVATAPEAGGSPGPVLYAIRVTVSWTDSGHQRSVELTTQRLADGPAP